MKPSSIVLDETVIKAELQKMKMSGDTLVYNTGAFKTSEGAVLQDLVRQLPGLELDEKSGKMNFHGKEITQILLNGKEFFADSKVALNNMPVDALKEVKVYEQQSDKEQMTAVPSLLLGSGIRAGCRSPAVRQSYLPLLLIAPVCILRRACFKQRVSNISRRAEIAGRFLLVALWRGRFCLIWRKYAPEAIAGR